MASRRRRRPVVAGRRKMGDGRQGLWIRQAAYSPTEVSASLGIFTDDVLNPSMWERLVQTGSQVKKGAGGPLLESMVCQYSVIVTNNTDLGSSLVIPTIEMLCSMQSSEFAPIITDNTTFDAALESQRVLWYELAPFQSMGARESSGGAYIVQRQFSGAVQSKMKARLSDKLVTQSFRLGFDTAATGITNVSVLANWFAFVTTP